MSEHSPRRLATFRYRDIHVGDTYEFRRTITAQDVLDFARLTGDRNPLHVDEEFGRRSAFGGNIVHGMLAASLFSNIIGMHCPGARALYLSQTLQFRKPLVPNQMVLVRGTVIAKHESITAVTLRTEVLVDGVVAVTGEAKARVLEEERGEGSYDYEA